jgi:restriction system protein
MLRAEAPMRRPIAKGPEFVKYFGPVLDALRTLGASGTPSEVREQVARDLGLSDEELAQTIPSGQSRFDNKVNWARFYLTKAGLIDGSERGVWRLTPIGEATKLNHPQSLDIFRTQHDLIKTSSPTGEPSRDDRVEEDEEAAAPEQDISTAHRDALAELLRSMTPTGFEQFSALLLRTAGFTEVNVTGKTNDGGIDGNGYLRINPMMTLRVLFQCKRYRDASVTKDDIMKFQAAVMRERAEKGLFVTTSSFTRGAREEALGGACEIELIDLDRLIELMEALRLGLIEKRAFSIDPDFFKPFFSKSA